MKKIGILVCFAVLCLTFTPRAHAITTDDLNTVLKVLKAVQVAFDAKAAPLTKSELISVITINSADFNHAYLTDDRVNAINDFLAQNVYGTIADYMFGPPDKILPIIDIVEPVVQARPELFEGHPDMMGALQQWRDLVMSGSDGHNGMALGETRSDGGVTALLFIFTGGTVLAGTTTTCVLQECTEPITRDGCTVDFTFAGTAYESTGALVAFMIPAGGKAKKVDCCGPILRWGNGCQIPGLEIF